MGKYSEYSQDTLKELSAKHSDCRFSFQHVEISVIISVFFVVAKSTVIEKDNLWQKISEEIALKFQPKLESVYEKWNLYVIYVTADQTSKELKNKIENDKFSSRKIVEENFSKELSKTEENQLIIKHITNSDLKEIVDKTPEVNIQKYIPLNTTLWKLLNQEDKVIGDKEAQEFIIKELNRE